MQQRTWPEGAVHWDASCIRRWCPANCAAASRQLGCSLSVGQQACCGPAPPSAARRQSALLPLQSQKLQNSARGRAHGPSPCLRQGSHALSTAAALPAACRASSHRPRRPCRIAGAHPAPQPQPLRTMQTTLHKSARRFFPRGWPRPPHSRGPASRSLGPAGCDIRRACKRPPTQSLPATHAHGTKKVAAAAAAAVVVAVVWWWQQRHWRWQWSRWW